MGDFLGFTFGGVRSSDLGITRVSGGDRYEEQLHPEIKDRTAEVPGLDGEYYFGSDFGTRTFDLEIAFDHLTEDQFRRLRKVFGTKEIKQLIFDERPYKYYMAKLESPVELSYVCFDEEEWNWETENHDNYIPGSIDHKVYTGSKRRIYKGEGKITFVCRFPFAKSDFKVLPEGQSEYEGSEEWAISSGILSREVRESQHIDEYDSGAIKVYNAGDVPTGFRLYIPGNLASTLTLTYQETGAKLIINPYTIQAGDTGVIINTDNQLIQGCTMSSNNNNYTYTTNGTIYNQYIKSGYFFKLEPNNYNITSTITISGGKSGILIFYDYLYF